MPRLEYVFDPLKELGLEIADRSDLEDALSEVAEYIKTEALSFIADGVSPVKGGSWKRSLSPEYKKLKRAISGADFANMELHGDMLDALDSTVVGKKIKYGISDSTQAAKADGHNNFSGDSQLPAREFIPNSRKGQEFRREIMSGVKEILLNYGARPR